MPQLVCSGAMMTCTFGVAPAQLNVLPTNRVNTANMPAVNILDHVPMMNIAAFGMCNAPSNPQVASATAAAGGVLTPMPCIPVTSAPWSPGSPTVKIGGQSALNSSSMLTCTWGGSISITSAGQATVNTA